QGERPMASDNVSLGSFNLTDLPPAPRGIPQIEVKFDIDANGIINVAAKDLGTKKEAKITVSSNSKLSKEEIEKLKEDAEKFSDEDKKKKEKIDLKNESESFIYTVEKLVNHDLKDKISQEQGIKISEAVKEVKESLDREIDELKPKLDTLKSIVNEVTTELYKNVTTESDSTQQNSGANEQQDQNNTQQNSESHSTDETKTY
ncbi:MAG: Hsp70 family protein, partial [Nitrosarchaeum sp.]|nr:Hsp70 family protein [Nitrosarchaeum sp.]